MPVQKGKSGLASKLGGKLKTAHEEHKEDELQLQGGGNLPDGIDNGIAQLVMMKFDTYKSGDNKGEYYFMAQGVVKLPKMVNGIPVEGERTKLGPEPLCDTPKANRRKTMSDHYGWILNEIRKFGVDTKDIEYENIEAVAAMLQEQQPHFKFRTWKGEATEQYPNPRVNEDWRGVCEFSGEVEDRVEDNSGNSGSAKAATKEEPTDESGGESEAGSNGDAVDYDALAATADDASNPDKDDAARIIVEACNAAGIAAADTDALPDWAAVVGLLKERVEGNGQAEPEEVIPKAKQVMRYHPLDSKTKKPSKKPVECEVTAVFDKNKTCNLRNLEDGKTTYKAVAWSELQGT